MRVVRRVDHDALDVIGVRHRGVGGAQTPGQVNPRLGLVLGRVFLGVAAQDRRLGLTAFRQRHRIPCLRAVEEPRDYAVLVLVDRRRTALPAHGPVHRLDGQLAGERRREGLP